MPTKATANENSVAATGNDYLDTLIRGNKWNKDHAVTFYFDNGAMPQDVWLDAAKDAMRSVLNTYENYIDLEFQEVNSAADANFVLRMDTLDEINATARFGYPDESDDQATGQFPSDWGRWTDWHLQQGGYAYETILHEVGHGLGLGHPHDSGGLNEQPFPGVGSNADPGTNGQNSAIYTVMSYLDKGESWAPQDPPNSDYGWGFPATPMAFDIAALQHIYGANTTHRSGNSTYTLPSVEGDGTFWSSIWDTGGTDVIRYTGNANAFIDLHAAPLTGQHAGGYLSNVDGIAGGFTIANGVVIENAEGGSGNDEINGNDAANHIQGNNGDDIINAFGGNDTVEGGAGNDTIDGGIGNNDLDGGSGSDHIDGGSNNDLIEGGSGDDFLFGLNGDDILHGGSGNDTLNGGGGIDTADYASATGWVHVDLEINGPQATGGAEDTDLLISIEELVGSNGFADQLRGSSVSNRLYGLGGNDTLEGRDGNDVLDGGMGSDTASYEFAPSGVSVNLSNELPQNTLGAGIDSFISIENLTGSAFADFLVGDLQNNALQGLDGNDWLLGGAGNDGLHGGDGDDVLSGGDGNDNLVGAGGIDLASYFTAAAAVTVSLAIGGYQNTVGAGSDQLIGVDNLQGSFFNDTLTGSQWDNTLWGGGGNDVLDGGGGVDAMIGELGNDRYFVDSASDTITEGVGQGALDRVFTASPSFTLAEGLEIEIFSTTDHFGTAAIDLTGNARAEYIIGNDGANIIAGGGGADTLWGRGGNDQYMINDAQAVVQEEAGAGIDRVFASVSYTLGDGAEVEILTTDAHAGTAAIDLLGNFRANYIVGNNGNNFINGGAGSDTLAGFSGADKFWFNTALGASNVDTIEDFVAADNSFWLYNSVFNGLSAGVLAEGAFRQGAEAADADDRILYNSATGAVSFDADGVGGTAAMQFATVTPGTTLVFNSFLVV